MPDDNYELVQSADFKNLKKDLDKLKENPLLDSKAGSELHESIGDLKGSLDQMLSIFKKASDEMTLEEKEERMVARQIKPIFTKVEQVADQNETIADGIVTVAEKVDALKKQVDLLQNNLSTVAQRLDDIENQAMFDHPSDMHTSQPSFDAPPLNPDPTMAAFQANEPPQAGPMEDPFPQNNAIPPLGPNQLEQEPKKKGLGKLFGK